MANILRFLGQRYDLYFINKDLTNSPLNLRKARVLVFIHLFLIVIASLFALANAQYPSLESPETILGVVIGVSLTVIFKKFGNFWLSGNLMALCLFSLFLEAVFHTGGLYSDNLLWMMASPLTALLFANSRSGMFWLTLLLIATTYFFLEDIQHPGLYKQQIQDLDGLYFYITYSGLFIMLVGIVLIFATGQSMIIRALDEKQKELTKQKTELARQTQALIEADEKLKEINAELEQFAYSASHDLKEPLRMIGSYVQLIKRKMNGHLDSATEEYMGFVTDGVKRMERMLNDLLQYSRLGRTGEQLKDQDLNETLLTVLLNLTAAMESTDAQITSNPLPTIRSSSIEMIQLFQNLISNSIKFRQPNKAPHIGITHKDEPGYHRFAFTDNGIGIPINSRQSIFNIFERLHSHSDYEGSGIGLATCKKIVSNLGGTIWVDEASMEGTTFIFTIPKSSNKLPSA